MLLMAELLSSSCMLFCFVFSLEGSPAGWYPMFPSAFCFSLCNILRSVSHVWSRRTIMVYSGFFLPTSLGKSSRGTPLFLLILEHPSFPLSFFRAEGKARAYHHQSEVSHRLWLPESQCSAANLVGSSHLHDQGGSSVEVWQEPEVLPTSAS